MSQKPVPDELRIDQHPRDPDFVQDPYALYRRLHALDSPVYWTHYGCWCIAGHAEVDRLLRDRRLSRVPPGGFPEWPPALADFGRVERGSLLSLEPPRHTSLRRRVTPAFLGRRIAALEPAFRTRCHAEIDRILAIDGVADGVSFDLVHEYASPLPVALITSLIGVTEVDGPTLVGWSNAMVRIYTESATEAERHAANDAAAHFDRYVRARIAAKRRTPGDDLLSTLCDASGGAEALDDADIVSLTILLLNAGHEATVHQLGNLAHAILSTPDVAARLRTGLGTRAELDALVEEGLRYDPPLHLFFRHATEPVEIGNGQLLSIGERVGLLLGAANRDPAKWDAPDAFRPEREPTSNVAFGAGRHFCAGAALARLELATAIDVLFERLPDLTLAERPRYADRFHFRGLESLRVSVARRANAQP